jgi:8-oxo-dGTP pyrophosphatase MutT (NUDIX family)
MGQVLETRADEPILAAGGIVWRIDSKPTVAIVHRKRHGAEGDWVLPKGKSELGEGILATALREAREETGCDVAAHEFVGSISYEADGRRKIVHFWRMEAGEPLGTIDSEVDQVRWLPIEAAVQTLSYPLEREFLLSTAKSGVSFDQPSNVSWWHKLFDTSTARLRRAIMSFQIELQQSIAKTGTNQNWASGALLSLDRADRAVAERDAEFGWHCLKTAQRLELSGMTQQELGPRAQCLVSEITEKLSSWRNDAVKQILLENGRLKSGISAPEIATAARLLHEHEGNSYRRLRLRSVQFGCLGVSALVFLACYVALVNLSGLSNDLSTWAGICQVVLLGALGAAISGILQIGSDKTARIPTELNTFGFLIARLVVGASAALLLVAVWQSGYVQFPKVEGTKFSIVLAFAAGFTERLAQNAIEKLTRVE